MAMPFILRDRCVQALTVLLDRSVFPGRRADRPWGVNCVWSVFLAAPDARGAARVCVLLMLSLLVAPLLGCRSIRDRTAKEDKLIAARELTRSGREAIQRGQWREAEVKFEHALQAHPSDPVTHRHYALALWNRDAQDQAIDHLSRAVELAGGEASWLAELGQMHLSQQRELKAMACAEQALAIDNHLAAGWQLQAALLEQQGKLEDALASYHRAVTLEPDSPELRKELAELYREMGRPRRALSTLQRVAELYAPGEVPADVAYLQGLAFKALNRHEDAIRSFAAAAAKDPAPDTVFELAQAHFLAGRIDEAREAAHQGIATHGETPQLVALLHHLSDLASAQASATHRISDSSNSDNRQLTPNQRR